MIAVGWLAVAALPVALSNEGVPHALRAVLMTPAVFLLAAIGGCGAYGWLTREAAAEGGGGGSGGAAGGAVLRAVSHVFRPFGRADPRVPEYFDARAAGIAGQIRGLPAEVEKYVAVSEPDPTAAAPVMFLTGSYTANEQRETHVHYIAAPCREVKESHPGAEVFCVE